MRPSISRGIGLPGARTHGGRRRSPGPILEILVVEIVVIEIIVIEFGFGVLDEVRGVGMAQLLVVEADRNRSMLTGQRYALLLRHEFCEAPLFVEVMLGVPPARLVGEVGPAGVRVLAQHDLRNLSGRRVGVVRQLERVLRVHRLSVDRLMDAGGVAASTTYSRIRVTEIDRLVIGEVDLSVVGVDHPVVAPARRGAGEVLDIELIDFVRARRRTVGRTRTVRSVVLVGPTRPVSSTTDGLSGLLRADDAHPFGGQPLRGADLLFLVETIRCHQPSINSTVLVSSATSISASKVFVDLSTASSPRRSSSSVISPSF